jgi:ferredoxin
LGRRDKRLPHDRRPAPARAGPDRGRTGLPGRRPVHAHPLSGNAFSGRAGLVLPLVLHRRRRRRLCLRRSCHPHASPLPAYVLARGQSDARHRAAIGLRGLGVATGTAVWLAAGFGLAGGGRMGTLSRKPGGMIHCTLFCPIGLGSSLLGRVLSFWRLRIGPGCDGCSRCARVCRYLALSPADLARGRPGHSCTLCGDCVGVCPGGRIGYRFRDYRPRGPIGYLYPIGQLHAVFLGVAGCEKAVAALTASRLFRRGVPPVLWSGALSRAPHFGRGRQALGHGNGATQHIAGLGCKVAILGGQILASLSSTTIVSSPSRS